MDSKLVEIAENKGLGFEPLIFFESWRVAILNADPSRFTRETTEHLEKHLETDEAFVLLSGSCSLYIGDGTDSVGRIEKLDLMPNKVYNVKKGVWHTLIGDDKLSLLIVENADTSKLNTEYEYVTVDQLPE